jgi:hypothetical protein
MDQPDAGDVHVNALLSNISIATMNDMKNFIADRAFPLVPVDKQTDLVPLYDDGYFMADEGNLMLRAPGTNAVTTGYKVSNTPFRCDNWAIGKEIPDEVRQNADGPYLQMDMDATNLVTQIQMIRRERAFASDFMKTSVWGTDRTGQSTADSTHVVFWSDYGLSDPIGDLRAAIRAVLLATGMEPNKLILGRLAWDRIADHPDFLDRVNAGQTPGGPATVGPSLLAALLGIDEVLIMNAVYRSSNEGAAVTTAFVVSDSALLVYTPNSPSLMTPSAGYTFFWKSAVNGANSPQFIRKVREDRPKLDIIEAYSYWDQVVTKAGAGYFFSAVVQ